MKNRIAMLDGTPHRVRVAVGSEPEDKFDFATSGMDEVVPELVVIEVGGGRSSTASAMRAARVQQTLEEVGAAARCVQLEGEHATVAAEVDRVQVLHVARLPFVRRISRS